MEFLMKIQSWIQCDKIFSHGVYIVIRDHNNKRNVSNIWGGTIAMENNLAELWAWEVWGMGYVFI